MPESRGAGLVGLKVPSMGWRGGLRVLVRVRPRVEGDGRGVMYVGMEVDSKADGDW